MRTRALLLEVVLATAVAGCSSPYKTPQVEGQQEFAGIDVLLRNSPSRKLDVILVHGMCTHDAKWANSAISNLLSALGQDATTTEKNEAFSSDVELYQRSAVVPSGELRITAVVWSPLTTGIKQRLCYDQTDRSPICSPPRLPYVPDPYPYERASLNAKFKDGLLNDCLSDALIYSGASRSFIVAEIQKALLFAAANPGGNPESPSAGDTLVERARTNQEPMVLVSESLGSKVTFDSIAGLRDGYSPGLALSKSDAIAVGDRLAGRTVQLFMAANQLPILSLAELSPQVRTAAESQTFSFPANPLDAFAGVRPTIYRNLDMPSRLHIVAFTDPNDLLSYVLVPSMLWKGEFELTDVVASNATTYAGFFSNPQLAHQGYRQNRAVWEMIACGSTRRC